MDFHLQSIIRICFHERRLQYMEKEQMTLWQRSRPGDRILEIDVPLSYGLFDVVQPPNTLNAVQFSWDPTKEVGVYIKVKSSKVNIKIISGNSCYLIIAGELHKHRVYTEKAWGRERGAISYSSGNIPE